MQDAIGGLVLIAAIAAPIGIYNGWFYTNGKEWYEKCYEYRTEKEKSGWEEPKTTDPYKAAFWARCELYSVRGMYNAGIVIAGTKSTPGKIEEISKVCPSAFRDIPLGGTFYLTLRLMQAQGGPSLVDKFSMAESMISRAYTTRWPHCAAERSRLGIPKVTEVREGVFE